MKQQQKVSRTAYATVHGVALPKTEGGRRDRQSERDRHRYLSNREAAEYLGVSESFLNKTRHFGTGPRFRRAGRLIKYLVQDLDDWMAAGCATSTHDYQK